MLVLMALTHPESESGKNASIWAGSPSSDGETAPVAISPSIADASTMTTTLESIHVAWLSPSSGECGACPL